MPADVGRPGEEEEEGKHLWAVPQPDRQLGMEIVSIKLHLGFGHQFMIDCLVSAVSLFGNCFNICPIVLYFIALHIIATGPFILLVLHNLLLNWRNGDKPCHFYNYIITLIYLIKAHISSNLYIIS